MDTATATATVMVTVVECLAARTVTIQRTWGYLTSMPPGLREVQL